MKRELQDDGGRNVDSNSYIKNTEKMRKMQTKDRKSERDNSFQSAFTKPAWLECLCCSSHAVSPAPAIKGPGKASASRASRPLRFLWETSLNFCRLCRGDSHNLISGHTRSRSLAHFVISSWLIDRDERIIFKNQFAYIHGDDIAKECASVIKVDISDSGRLGHSHTNPVRNAPERSHNIIFV